MLCTNCSAVVKPVVAIDIDGTLGDYHSHFLQFAQAYMGLLSHQWDFDYHGDIPFGLWFCERFRTDLTQFRQIKLAYRQGGQKRTMPVYEGALVLVEGLRREGAEVWLTTTRPYLRLDNVDPDTRHWLTMHGLEFDGMLYDEDKYTVLAELVDPERVVVVLDDLQEQCEAADLIFGGGTAILRKTRWNSATYGSTPNYEVEDLSVAFQHIKERVKSWSKESVTS